MTDQNKDMLVAYFTAFGRRDVTDLAACTTDDYVHEMMGSTIFAGRRTKQQMIALLEGLKSQGLKEGRFTFHEMVSEGDMVSAIITSQSELPGGEVVNGLYCVMCRLRNGKITSMRELFDTKYMDEVMSRMSDKLST